MLKISIIFITLFIALLFSLPSKAEAAKKFVKKTTPVKKTVSKASSIPAIVRYRADKKGLLLSFANFTGIEAVNYSFTYTSGGISQGAGGTVTSSNNPTSERELLFGTCSASVCRYHSNLTSASLSLRAKFTNGKSAVKNYRVKTYF